MKPILNLAEVELKPRPQSFAATGDAIERFDASRGEVASLIGARLLGYNVTAIPPGKSAFPAHNHHVNEEMFLILKGEGTLHIGDKTYPVRENDIVACPPGGPETAHRLCNSGAQELRFLAVSTMQSPEYVEYPDSGKFAVIAQRPDERGRFMYVGKEEEGMDYWSGE